MCNTDADHELKKPDIDWKAVKAEVEAREELRDRIRLDDDGGHCSINLKKYTAALVKPASHHTSHHIAPKGNLNSLAPGDAFKSVMPVETGMVWAQIPCAVDSGACAHMSPPDIFGTSPKDSVTKAKYSGADGSPIDEYGKLSVNAALEGGMAMTTA